MNENISAKDLLNLILGNQETPTITENKEMDLNEAISYFLNNQIKNSIETLKYYKIEFNCLRPYFKMYNIKSTKDLNNDFVNKLITIKKNEGVKNITINKMLGTIKIMLNFLIIVIILYIFCLSFNSNLSTNVDICNSLSFNK